MRQPKPWYWKARKAWYVQLDGKQTKLHENEKKATAEFYRIMASHGRLDDRQAARMTVAGACEALMASVAHSRPNTLRNYRATLGPFAAAFCSRRLEDVTPEQAIRFVGGYQGRHQKGHHTFGESSRHLMFRYIKTLFRWARDTGILQINPFASVRNPWVLRTRNRVMTPAEYALIMGHSRPTENFKEVLEIIWRTGARPEDVARLAARHLDARKPIARFQPSEHKTGTKTGLQREVYFPEDLMARMRAYAIERPRGPLLRNAKGHAWTQATISMMFAKTRRNLGLPDGLVIYMARHGFITRLVEAGVPLARVAKLAGHTHPETVMKNYYHPDADTMLADVENLAVQR